MSIRALMTLIMACLVAYSCAKKTTDNVDNIDHSTDRMADQMQEYQSMLKVYAVELELMRAELGLFKESFLPLVAHLHSLALSAQGIEKNVQLAMDQVLPMLEAFKDMVKKEQSDVSIEPEVTEDDLLKDL